MSDIDPPSWSLTGKVSTDPSVSDAENAALGGDAVAVTGIAAGGAGIGRAADGRIMFVKGALPGETVRVRVDRVTKQFAEATAIEVCSSSPQRVDPPCPEVARGCGGCDWQHVEGEAQRDLRREVVIDALRRIGKFTIDTGARSGVGDGAVSVLTGPALAVEGYRTVLRAAVVGGRAGFRRERSHEIVVGDHCRIAHPLAEELLIEGRFPGADEVRIVVGARTGERMVVVHPDPRSGGLGRVDVPDDVVVIATDEVRAGRLAWVHEEIHGHLLRISAGSFFQCRPDGAEALVDLVRPVVEASGGAMLDAYAGVGLFAVSLGGPSVGSIVAVESNPSSAADARHNLCALADRARVVESRVERWEAQPMDVVVADPSRRGLERAGADRLAATGATSLVLVSCDPASLARDARLLVDHGFTLDHVTVVDLFGHTSHVEAVSVLRR